MSDPIFRFTMRAVPADTSGYYRPRWDTAEKMTILGGTRKEAMEKAVTMLGEVRSGRKWIFEFDRIDEVSVASQQADELEQESGQ
jgi:hypothetical protein